MRKVKTFSFTIVAVIGMSVVWAGAQNFAPSTNVSDSSIEQKVGKRLRNLARSNVFDHITYQVNGGTVILGGKVSTLGTKREAGNVVKGIKGVSEVVNNIEDLPPSPFDDRIRREAYSVFVSRGPAQYFSTIDPEVRIIVEHGRLTLEGYVYRQADSNTLNILANGISGVFSVTNNLVVGKRVE